MLIDESHERLTDERRPPGGGVQGESGWDSPPDK
jgi:hypothetical protein